MEEPDPSRPSGDYNGRSVLNRMSFLKDFLLFLRVRKKLWMLPILLLVALAGALVILTQEAAIAPFIYALF